MHGELLLSIDGPGENDTTEYLSICSLARRTQKRRCCYKLQSDMIYFCLPPVEIALRPRMPSGRISPPVSGSYLLMRRMVNTVPPDTNKAMAAEGVETPGGVYLE